MSGAVCTFVERIGLKMERPCVGIWIVLLQPWKRCPEQRTEWRRYPANRMTCSGSRMSY